MSWIDSANQPGCPFPIQNLPYGVFSAPAQPPRCGVAIGDFVLDLCLLERGGLVDAGGGASVFDGGALNPFMALGKARWEAVRSRLTELLSRDGDPVLRDDAALRAQALRPLANARLHLPFKVAGFTDFYSGRHHAFNVGTMSRGPQNALPPNWLSMPIAYNGRASTVVVSAAEIRRPLGQRKPAGVDLPVFGPSRRLDFEMEIGAVVGVASEMGEPITVAEADEMIFGYVLLNDWSARDIQAWESQPLGPFQGKVFATSISPWIVAKAALEPFRVWTPARERPLLPYLREAGPMLYDIKLKAMIRPEGAARPTVVSRANYCEMYYSAAQQLAQHAVGGCKMETGDLLGSGTISGPTREAAGSMLELSRGGAEPVTLATGESRRFLEDGDTVTLTGWAEGEGYRIGFGECVGAIRPAPAERPW